MDNMENIQNRALETFLENLKFLEKNNKVLYDRINALSNAIETNEYKERYHLEYIKEDEEFDIYDTVTTSYVYNRKPNEFIKKAVLESNFDKKSTLDLLLPKMYNQNKPPYIDDTQNQLTRTTNLCASEVFDYIKLFQKSTVYKGKKFKYFEKFVFAGVLLGTHIEKIVDKLNLGFIFLYEYNIEIFRLSLFTTNYNKLSKKSHIYLSVMEDKEQLENTIHNFFHYAFRSNYLVKYYCTNYNINDFFDRVLSVTSQKTPFAYTHWKMLISMLEPSIKHMLKYPTLQTNNPTDILSTQSVLILAAGPSFGKNIEWIKKNQNKFFIIAIGAVVKRLIDEDIKIDMITNVDGDEILKGQFPDEIKDEIKDIPFLAAPNTYDKIIEMFDEQNVILYEAMSGYKHNSFLVQGYSVGEVTLNLAHVLGAREIYLLGSDLALDQETGRSHADGHDNLSAVDITDTKKEHNSAMKTGNYTLSKSTLLAKGNFTDTVVTNVIFEKSIIAYAVVLKRIHDDSPQTKVYNLNDGAYFDGAIPLHIEDVVVSENQSVVTKKRLFDELQEYLSIGFTDAEKLDFKGSVEYIDNLIVFIKELQKLKVKSYMEFNTQRDEILVYVKKDFKKYERFYLDRMFINYIFMTEPYIGYQFNDKELKNEANYIKKVKKIWCSHMLELAYKYKDIVKEIY
ncbi:MAG: 6-hydroxymethylpterin diphosphokinase MptE-like protein [Campylobacterota bacterium]|nr:6-hydroxymethylpterin diphosphokinase MptE-like protein [Campylobacterota bacterium]